MKNGIGSSFDCADVMSVSQISRSERATTCFAVFGRVADSFGTERSGVPLAIDGTSLVASTAARTPAMPHVVDVCKTLDRL